MTAEFDGTARASEAQVEALRKALGWSFADEMIPTARLVANAVVAAGTDADEVTRLRAEVEHWKHHAWEAGEGFKRAIESENRARAEVKRLADEVERLRADYATLADGFSAQVQHARRHRIRAEAAEAEAERLTEKVATLDPLVDSESRRADRWKGLAKAERHVSRDYNEQFEKAEAERERLAEVVARVEALHPRGETWYEPGEGDVTTDDDRIEDGCQACRVPWPCATIAALSEPTPAETSPREQCTSGQSKPTCGGCGATWPELHVYHPGPGGALCVKCGWTPDDGTPTAEVASKAEGQSGTGQALGGAEKGEWRARCVVPGCEWFSLPYKAREGADKAGYNHWLLKGHGSTIRGRARAAELDPEEVAR